MTNLSASELILNPDGSVYHLHLVPQEVAPIVIFVGDPERVDKVSKYFDKVEVKHHHREFFCHTGYIGSTRLSVISTGIGTDNIDIVMNELDALVNVDFETRTAKKEHTSLSIIRLGTSGSLQKHINVDSLLISEYALGLDGLMNFYDYKSDETLLETVKNQVNELWDVSHFYTSKRSLHLSNESGFEKGITLTCPGFYAPQNRSLRLESKLNTMFDTLTAIKWNNLYLSNMEMETAGIYGMATALGHKAISVNAILANRVTHQFSNQMEKTIENMIEKVLGMITLT